jgi:hypothetical protein
VARRSIVLAYSASGVTQLAIDRNTKLVGYVGCDFPAVSQYPFVTISLDPTDRSAGLPAGIYDNILLNTNVIDYIPLDCPLYKDDKLTICVSAGTYVNLFFEDPVLS